MWIINLFRLKPANWNMLRCKQLVNNYHFKKSAIYMYTKYGRCLLCLYDILYSRLFNSTNLFSAKVNGGWGTWGQFTPCGKSCGGGIQVRFRSCDHPSPSNGGLSCIGDSLQTASCNSQQCPGNFWIEKKVHKSMPKHDLRIDIFRFWFILIDIECVFKN